MRQIPLGRTGLRVSEMIFGGAPIGGLYAPVTDDQAAAALEAAWTAGIRAFDTAPHYGVGLSEQRIGHFLSGRPREEYVLSTKVGRRLVPATGDVEGAEGFYGTPKLARVRDYSRDGALATLEGSLRRLGTDHIDIALIHYAPAPADMLDQAQRIRAVCARYGVPIGAAAIRFVLRHPAVTAIVVGARDAAEVNEDVSYLTAAVPAELFSDLAAEQLIPTAADRPLSSRQHQ
jgi:D-threo-aldose 1-dehydrogenase